MTLNPRTEALLHEEEVPYTVLDHEAAFTAFAAARAAHVPGHQFAKVLVVQGDRGGPLMAVLPSTSRLDFEALADVTGHAHLALLDEWTCHHLFPDCEVGAMPPLGGLYGLPVYVDRCLSREKALVFNGGNHREAIRMSFAEFARITRPVIAEFCRPRV